MILCSFVFPEATNFNLFVGSNSASTGVPSGVVTVPPASLIMRKAAATSVVRIFPRRSTKASVDPSAT